MTTSLLLTTAEIAALLALPDGMDGERATTLLKLEPDQRGDTAKRAGLASLLVRELLAVDGDQVELSDALSAVVEVLTSFTRCLELGIVGAVTDGALLFDAPEQRIVISPRKYGCYSVRGVDAEVDLPTAVGRLARAYLDAETEAVMAVVPADPQPDASRSALVGRNGDSWRFAAGASRQFEPGTAGEVVHKLVDHLRSMSPT